MNPDHLIPRNRTQKAGVFVAIAAALLLLALHNPLSGYVTTEERLGIHIPGINLFPCDDDWTSNADGVRYFCQDGHQVRRLSPSEWHTVSPATPWLGRFSNMLTLLGVDLLAAFAWVLLFRPESD